MKRVGVCIKCGERTIVQDHHSKGYFPPYQDYVEPYCHPCDIKAHRKAREEGKCKLNHSEVSKLTQASSSRRRIKQRTDYNKNNYYFNYGTTIDKNILLHEDWVYNPRTQNVFISTGFCGTNGHKLKYVDEEGDFN